MAKRSVLLLVIVAALLVGCATGESAEQSTVPEVSSEPAAPVASPPSTEAATPTASPPSTATATCDQLADEVIEHLQVIVDELSAATLDDLAQDDLLPEGLEQELDELEARVRNAGCDEDDQMDQLLAERANRIQGNSILAEAVREGLSQGEDLPF